MLRGVFLGEDKATFGEVGLAKAIEDLEEGAEFGAWRARRNGGPDKAEFEKVLRGEDELSVVHFGGIFEDDAGFAESSVLVGDNFVHAVIAAETVESGDTYADAEAVRTGLGEARFGLFEGVGFEEVEDEGAILLVQGEEYAVAKP